MKTNRIMKFNKFILLIKKLIKIYTKEKLDKYNMKIINNNNKSIIMKLMKKELRIMRNRKNKNKK